VFQELGDHDSELLMARWGFLRRRSGAVAYSESVTAMSGRTWSMICSTWRAWLCQLGEFADGLDVAQR